MKCERCNKREATTHITKIVNGYREDYYLCPECAAKSDDYKEMKESMSFGIGDFLTGMFTGANKQSVIGDSVSDICPSCHMSYSEFMKKGKLGCGDCYSAFKNRIMRPLKQIHGSVEHIGKTPHRSGNKLILNKKISVLEAELNDAVLRQDFETAAKLRDEIRDIKIQNNGKEA